MAVFIDFEVSEISDFRKSTSEGTQNVCHEVIKANLINMPGLVIFQKRAYIEKIVLNVPQYCNFLSSAFIRLYWQTFVIGIVLLDQGHNLEKSVIIRTLFRNKRFRGLC